MTRKQQLWALIGLAALTACLQYALQGALATKASLTAFHPYFWIADYVLWAVRALIEAWVIVYLFVTQARTLWQLTVLTCFEVGLIALITLTLGPALRSVGLGQTVAQSLAEVYLAGWNAGYALFWLWNFGIAAYTSLMMAGAGFAYRMQPADESESLSETTAVKLRLASVSERNVLLLDEFEKRELRVAQAVQAVSWLARQTPTAQIRLLVLASEDGNQPTVKELADWFGVPPPVAAEARASAEEAASRRRDVEQTD